MELKDCIKYITSEDYKERMIGEYFELIIRINKLENVIERAKNGEFSPTCPIELLTMQLEHMKSYSDVLFLRSQIENINFESYFRKEGK